MAITEGPGIPFIHADRNRSCPEAAIENGVSGTVVARFVVTAEGSIEHIEILKSVHPDLDREVIRILQIMPDFIPGMMNGRYVSVYYTLPVRFYLQH